MFEAVEKISALDSLNLYVTLMDVKPEKKCKFVNVINWRALYFITFTIKMDTSKT